MAGSRAEQSRGERLRASPNFVLAHTFDGRPYVAKETEPYVQYWLDERYRVLHGAFSSRRGATSEQAIRAYLRVTGASDTAAERRRLSKAIDDMRTAGVLIGTRDDISRYDAGLVDAYLTHRPFPSELSDLIVRNAPVTRTSRVLDLAGGPGDLALKLAEASDQVALMELSRGFLTAATRRAKQRGLSLTALHESANRLVYQDDTFDVVTISQALHWLDDVMVCRGLCRLLTDGGSFFVVHSSMALPEAHPLSFVLGDNSILGAKPAGSFVDEVQPLLRRLTLLFEALDAPDVQRMDPTQQWRTAGGPDSRIAPAAVTLFRQRRPFGLGYARAFLTRQHIEAAGHDPQAVWAEIERRCAGAASDDLLATQNWAVLHFRRGAVRAELAPLGSAPVVDIGFAAAEAAAVPAAKAMRKSADVARPHRDYVSRPGVLAS
jgi:2-polyprenyl-3-methyl-5-hydroxy-6-metoxy-1,4-benzoquinol methylase